MPSHKYAFGLRIKRKHTVTVATSEVERSTSRSYHFTLQGHSVWQNVHQVKLKWNNYSTVTMRTFKILPVLKYYLCAPAGTPLGNSTSEPQGSTLTCSLQRYGVFRITNALVNVSKEIIEVHSEQRNTNSA